VLVRRLKGRPPASDLFGVKGRAWLGELELPIDERETVDAGLRQIAFLETATRALPSAVANCTAVLARGGLNSPRLITGGVSLRTQPTRRGAAGNWTSAGSSGDEG
jgi:transposase